MWCSVFVSLFPWLPRFIWSDNPIATVKERKSVSNVSLYCTCEDVMHEQNQGKDSVDFSFILARYQFNWFHCQDFGCWLKETLSNNYAWTGELFLQKTRSEKQQFIHIDIIHNTYHREFWMHFFPFFFVAECSPKRLWFGTWLWRDKMEFNGHIEWNSYSNKKLNTRWILLWPRKIILEHTWFL